MLTDKRRREAAPPASGKVADKLWQTKKGHDTKFWTYDLVQDTQAGATSTDTLAQQWGLNATTTTDGHLT